MLKSAEERPLGGASREGITETGNQSSGGVWDSHASWGWWTGWGCGHTPGLKF